jgi:hypothetical protein
MSNHRTLARWRDGALAFWRRSKARRVALALAAAVFLLELAAGEFMTDYLLPKVWLATRWLVSQPVGFFGVLLVILLAVLMVGAALETSPIIAELRERRRQAKRGEAAISLLSPAEQFEVEFVRQVWANCGHDACRAVSSVLDNCIAQGAESNGYLRLLRYPRDRLNGAIDRFEASLNVNAPLPFAELKTRLVELIAAYVHAVGWMNQYIADNPSYLTSGSYNISKWEEWHARFATDIDTQLAGRSRFQGLRILPKKEGRTIFPS